MALLENELSIITVSEVFGMELTVPVYQRPYSWSKETANTLFNDTFAAFKQDIPEYRLGSVILHKDNNSIYSIVDGQQRITTLAIIFYVLGSDIIALYLEQKFAVLSEKALIENRDILKNAINRLNADIKEKYLEYLKNKCKIVKIVTDSEEDAFQFFDSQNSRGKELAPHDLLKSYHLREMSDLSYDIKSRIVCRWEDTNQQELANFFSNYLYPLNQWYKKNSGLNYSSKDIIVFKGIKRNNSFNYALYHRAANLYVEEFNVTGNAELMGINEINQFQITQPLLAGKRFFEYSLHYFDLYKKVLEKIKSNFSDEHFPASGEGDRYVRLLFENSVLFYADRFSLESVTHEILDILYIWAYSLRLAMYSVYPTTINNYALGKNDRINKGRAVFEMMSRMLTPSDINLIILDNPQKEDKKNQKYEFIREYINEKVN